MSFRRVVPTGEGSLNDGQRPPASPFVVAALQPFAQLSASGRVKDSPGTGEVVRGISRRQGAEVDQTHHLATTMEHVAGDEVGMEQHRSSAIRAGGASSIHRRSQRGHVMTIAEGVQDLLDPLGPRADVSASCTNRPVSSRSSPRSSLRREVSASALRGSRRVRSEPSRATTCSVPEVLNRRTEASAPPGHCSVSSARMRCSSIEASWAWRVTRAIVAGGRWSVHRFVVARLAAPAIARGVERTRKDEDTRERHLRGVAVARAGGADHR